MEDDSELGGRFWLTLVGLGLAAAIGAIVVFALIGAVWYSWGLIGVFLFFLALAGVASLVERRRRRRYEEDAVSAPGS